MKHIKVTDEWLYKYMPIAENALIREIEGRIDTRWKFSSKFERKMKRLIRIEAHSWIMKMQSIFKK